MFAPKSRAPAVVALAGLAALLSACLPGISRLEPGWAAVKIDYASGQRTSIPAGGYVSYNPITERVAEYPIGQQSLVMVRSEKEGQVTGDDSVEIRVGGVAMHVDTTLFWRINPDHVADMYQLRPGVPLVGKTINDGIDGIVVRRLVRGEMQDAASLFTSYADVYGNQRQAYADAVAAALGCPGNALAQTPDTAAWRSPPDTALGREYVICDKFQLGEVYLNAEQAKAISDRANAETAVQTSAQNKLAAENDAQAKAAPIRANAQAEADSIKARESALAQAPHVMQYDVQMQTAQHPALVQGGGGALLQVPAPATPAPSPAVTATPAPAAPAAASTPAAAPSPKAPGA